MTTGTLSSKGWVVIPGELRKRYQLKKGDKVHFIDYGGVVAIVPVSKNPIKKASGSLKGNTSLIKSLLKYRTEDKTRGK